MNEIIFGVKTNFEISFYIRKSVHNYFIRKELWICEKNSAKNYLGYLTEY